MTAIGVHAATAIISTARSYISSMKSFLQAMLSIIILFTPILSTVDSADPSEWFASSPKHKSCHFFVDNIVN